MLSTWSSISYNPLSDNNYELFLKFLIIYLFMAVLGLRFCARAVSSCGKWGPLFIVVRGPLTIAASLVVEHRLQTRRFSNCGSRAQLLRGMWDLPRPGLEPVSPALAGRFSTTAPPGKPTMNSWQNANTNTWRHWRMSQIVRKQTHGRRDLPRGRDLFLMAYRLRTGHASRSPDRRLKLSFWTEEFKNRAQNN